MKIFRDGKEYELTKEELFEAYLEQESIYDRTNIVENMEEHLSPEQYARLNDNEDFIEEAISKLRKNQDHYEMDYDSALATAFQEASAEFLLPVNRVTIIRERWSEHESWSDDFWVDTNQVPSKELFQKAIEDFLFTKDGKDAIEDTCNDFNWGDCVLYVPDEIWNKYGIYPLDVSRSPQSMGLEPTSSDHLVTITVNQDEVLIPEDYLERLEAIEKELPTLDDQIKSASNRTVVPVADKIPPKESSIDH